MTDWVLTATSMYCEMIEDEVTLIVNRDGTAQCTVYNKLAKPGSEAARRIKSRSKKLGKTLRCQGLECRNITQYRDSLQGGDVEAVIRSADDK